MCQPSKQRRSMSPLGPSRQIRQRKRNSRTINNLPLKMPMAKVNSFRGWLATWLQDRRRSRQQPAPTPNAPEINGGGYEDGTTESGWWDVFIDWSFNHGGFPVATMEVWLSTDGGAFTLWATVSSDAPGYYYPLAADNERTFDFKVRYRNGATVGPFSNVYQINITV
jgi:hypothetical protein